MSPTALNENHNKQQRCIDSRYDVYGFPERDALRVMRVIGCPVVLSIRRIDRLWMLVLTQDYETGLKLSVRYDAGSGQEREKREVRDVFVMGSRPYRERKSNRSLQSDLLVVRITRVPMSTLPFLVIQSRSS